MAARVYKRFQRCRSQTLLAQFKDLRTRSTRLYSQLFCAYIRESVASCGTQADIWRTLNRVDLLKYKSAQPCLDPDVFADFLLDLPGGSDPDTDLVGLIPELGPLMKMRSTSRTLFWRMSLERRFAAEPTDVLELIECTLGGLLMV